MIASSLRSGASERVGPVMVAEGKFLVTHGRARGVEFLVTGKWMTADLVYSLVELYDCIRCMDWLDQYRVHLECHRSRVVLERSRRRLVCQGVKPTSESLVNSWVQAEAMTERLRGLLGDCFAGRVCR